MEASLRVFTLGGLKIWRGDEPVTNLGSRKTEALIVYLLSIQRPQAREVLADLLWDDRPQKQAFTNLRGVISILRKQFKSFFLITHTEVSLHPEVRIWFDAAEFESGQRAIQKTGGVTTTAEAEQAARVIDLYQGEFLEGFYVGKSRGFDAWTVQERERLHHLALSVLSDLVTYYLEHRDYQHGIANATRLLELDPLMESAHRQMMHLLALSGKRALALKQYQTLCQILERELGIEPDAQSHSLYEDIQRGRIIGAVAKERVLPRVESYHQNNLPIQLTSFIGRQRDISSLKALLQPSTSKSTPVRLLTLTGPGGSGKSRLALQVATELVEMYPAGAWFVELAGLSDPTLVTREVAAVLGVTERPNQEIAKTLINFLQSRAQLLLVLDNCEHLLQACAELSLLLLKNCPDLQILATSRQSLGVDGEAIWPVLGLSLRLAVEVSQGEAKHGQPLEEPVPGSEAVQLFAERALLVQPRFSLTADNVIVAAQICRNLDGMPLAIELAAAWMNILSAEEIAARLDDRFKFLRARGRGFEERHQTLQAVVDWSYELMAETERVLFNRLSIFKGGFTLGAAEWVCGDGFDREKIVLDLLSSLIEKSMVVAEPVDEGGTRYRLLETLRQFAQERLVESGESRVIQQRHAEYFMALAKETDPKLRGPEQVTWLEYLETQHDNLRSALDWTAKNDAEIGLRLASALWWFWIMRGYFREGREWLEKFLNSTKSAKADIANVRACVRYAFLMSFLLDDKQHKPIAAETLKLSRRAEDEECIAWSLYLMAEDPYYMDDETTSLSLLEESLDLFRQIGSSWGTAAVLGGLAEIAYVRQRDYGEARRLALESLSHSRNIGDRRSIAIVLSMLGDIEQRLRNWESADSYYQESLSHLRPLKDPSRMALLLWKIATLATGQEDYQRARKMREASVRIFRELNQKGYLAHNLASLAHLAFVEGQFDLAIELCDESEEIADQINNRGLSVLTLLVRGEIARHEGDYTTAFRQFSEMMNTVTQFSLTHQRRIDSLEALARLAISQKQVERGVKILGATEALRDTISYIHTTLTRERVNNSMSEAQAHLDKHSIETAWEHGEALAAQGWGQVIEYVLAES